MQWSFMYDVCCKGGGAVKLRDVVLLLLASAIAFAQSLTDCKTVFIQPMPESLDRFVSAELFKWGAFKVVVTEEKADCSASFGRRTANVNVKSTGSAVVPAETSIKAEGANEELPRTELGKAAALQIVHRESSVVVWADSKTDTWSVVQGPQALAKKLVDQLKKDYGKKKP
jgi:hypothetical protein